MTPTGDNGALEGLRCRATNSRAIRCEFRVSHNRGIKPRTVRTAAGDTAKGYQLTWFEDAFERYLSLVTAKPHSAPVTPSQVNDLNDLEQKQTVTSDLFVTVEDEPNPLKTNTCDGVTVEKPDLAVTGDNGALEGPFQVLGPAPGAQCMLCGSGRDVMRDRRVPDHGERET